MGSDRIAGDTIAALSTAQGRAAIGVLRISGPDAGTIAARIFRTQRGEGLAPGIPGLKPREAVLGWIVDPERDLALDRVLVILFQAPRSYTGEDLLEIHAHGGTRNLADILDLVLASGARLAEPGEFTLRAFLGSKLGLTEAEAVADLIEADSEAAAAVARRQMKGELGLEVQQLREGVLEQLVELEAELDFPDEEEVHRLDRGQQLARLAELSQGAGRLARSTDWGERMLAGLQVLLVGPPNAGKSSLFNRLLGDQRALVHEAAGTTRDVLEARADCQGLPVVLIDGAGWNEQAEGLERAGQALLDRRIAGASLAVVVLDGSQALVPGLPALFERLGDLERVLVVNKIDLGRVLESEAIEQLSSGAPCLELSARTGQGVDRLWQDVGQRLRARQQPGPLATRARHREGLLQTSQALDAATDLIEQDSQLELAAEELRLAVRALDRLCGREYDGELLDRVFSRFCLGK